MIDQDLSLVFYDLTTVKATGASDVQGDVRADGKAKSGLIERQFMLSDGLPIDHQVHSDNTAEAPTLLPMIRELVTRYPLKRVVLVALRLTSERCKLIDDLVKQGQQRGG